MNNIFSICFLITEKIKLNFSHSEGGSFYNVGSFISGNHICILKPFLEVELYISEIKLTIMEENIYVCWAAFRMQPCFSNTRFSIELEVVHFIPKLL